MLLVFNHNRTFRSLILLIFSCTIVFSDSALETSNATANVSPAAITLSTAKCWSQVFSIPNEGYKILHTMQPAPCRNLFRPSVLIPVSELSNGCMPRNVLKKISPAHGDINWAFEMGYTAKFGMKNGSKAAASWLLVITEYYVNSSWRSLFKFCSIEVDGVPHVGIAIMTGTLWKGASGLSVPDASRYGTYLIKQC